MPNTKEPTNIRDLREFKRLSQDAVAAAAGLTYSRFVRIEEGSGKTTPEEVASVMAALTGMEPGTRKLAGRPFKDATKQAAVIAARETGTSVAAAIGVQTPSAAPAPAKKAPAAKATPAAAPAAKATPAKKGNLAASLTKPRSRKNK